MNYLSNYNGIQVDLKISSKKYLTGILIDHGLDIAVIDSGKQFYYIPLLHVQHMKLSDSSEVIEKSGDPPIIHNDQRLTFRNILNNAKGTFVEVYVSGNQSIYGYVNNIMNNYLVFYSPVYKVIFIPINHVKWLIPYNVNQTPYSLSNQHFPVKPTNTTLARTFEEQIKKCVGKVVVFDLGEDPNKIGRLNSLENNMIELSNGRGETIHWNLFHLKTLQAIED
ncbi:DUF2642 domain-containing protein [bacterium LRH843]|nr:DUF2642 domain-containing protein [bacterium LRH843]